MMCKFGDRIKVSVDLVGKHVNDDLATFDEDGDYIAILIDTDSGDDWWCNFNLDVEVNIDTVNFYFDDDIWCVGTSSNFTVIGDV